MHSEFLPKSPTTRLRLVADDVANAPPPTHSSVQQARRVIAAENHASRGINPLEVREAFALSVETALEGGRAAILRPRRRRQLIAAAVGNGLRPFEANLIVASVQDSVRHRTGSLVAQRAKPLKPSARIRLVLLIAITAALAIALFSVFLALLGGVDSATRK